MARLPRPDRVMHSALSAVLVQILRRLLYAVHGTRHEQLNRAPHVNSISQTLCQWFFKFARVCIHLFCPKTVSEMATGHTAVMFDRF